MKSSDRGHTGSSRTSSATLYRLPGHVHGPGSELLSPTLAGFEKAHQLAIEKAMGDLANAVDDTFFELASRGQDSTVHNLYFEAMREYRIKRKGLEKRLEQCIHQLWHYPGPIPGEGAGPGPHMLRTAKPTRIDDRLDLAVEDGLEQAIAVEAMIEKARQGLSELLADSEEVFARLYAEEADTDSSPLNNGASHNPLAPDALCHAFATGLEQLDIGIREKLIVLKHFDRQVLPVLPVTARNIYQMVVRHLGTTSGSADQQAWVSQSDSNEQEPPFLHRRTDHDALNPDTENLEPPSSPTADRLGLHRQQRSEAGLKLTEAAWQAADSAVQKIRDQQGLPPILEELLASGWNRVMVGAQLDETSTRDFDQSVRILEELAWCLQAHTTTEARQRWVRLVPQLLKHVRKGLGEAGGAGSGIDSLLTRLKQALTEAFKQPVPTGVDSATAVSAITEHNRMADTAESGVATPSANQRETTLPVAQPAAHQNAPLQRTAVDVQEEIESGVLEEYCREIDELQPGQWIELSHIDGRLARYRISRLDERNDAIEFVDRYARHAFVRERLYLAHELRRNRLRILRRGAMLDRFCEAVCRRATGRQVPTR